jgi:hypothetical protein
MKTFVIGLFAAVAVSALLSNSAHAQSLPAQFSPGVYYNQYLPSGSLADQRAIVANNRGLSYCLSMQGKVVGNGQCTALVEMHLAVSGAVPGNFSDPKNYIWGAVPNGWIPGDVLQFEGCSFEWKEGNRTRKVTMEHHTAVIVSINDKVVTLVHQNGPNGGAVVVDKVDFKGQQRGTIKGWRPVGNY